MPNPSAHPRYRNAYARLLRFYPAAFRAQFGEAMVQTFGDLLRERAEAGKPLFRFALWVFAETLAGILKENARQIMKPNNSILRLAIVTVVILLIPLVGMQFSDDVKWSATDFIFAGSLIFGSGLAYQLIARKVGARPYRVAVALALVGAFLLVWINAAVGIIGSEDNPANLMYAGVLLVGVVGAAWSRLRPVGMARVLFAMAFVQSLIGAIAVIGNLAAPVNGPVQIAALNAIFVGIFCASALLFRRADGGAMPAAPTV